MTLWPDFGGAGEYGIPYVTVPADQPGVPVAFDVGDESDPGPYPIPPDAPVEGGGDRHVLVVRQGECKLYELFAAERAGAGWTAGSGAVFDLRSNALRPRRLDVRRRRRPADPPRARAPRRGRRRRDPPCAPRHRPADLGRLHPPRHARGRSAAVRPTRRWACGCASPPATTSPGSRPGARGRAGAQDLRRARGRQLGRQPEPDLHLGRDRPRVGRRRPVRAQGHPRLGPGGGPDRTGDPGALDARRRRSRRWRSWAAPTTPATRSPARSRSPARARPRAPPSGRAHARVAAAFRAAGLTVTHDRFAVPGKGRSRNVIGVVERPRACLWILMAHADTVPPVAGRGGQRVGRRHARRARAARGRARAALRRLARRHRRRGAHLHRAAGPPRRERARPPRARRAAPATCAGRSRSTRSAAGRAMWLRSPARRRFERRVLAAAARHRAARPAGSPTAGTGNSDHREFGLAGLHGGQARRARQPAPPHGRRRRGAPAAGHVPARPAAARGAAPRRLTLPYPGRRARGRHDPLRGEPHAPGAGRPRARRDRDAAPALRPRALGRAARRPRRDRRRRPRQAPLPALRGRPHDPLAPAHDRLLARARPRRARRAHRLARAAPRRPPGRAVQRARCSS